uniref:Uncharacterized protein n=1 Tax=Ixodes ricinus TaxID=34613 RepID=A0A6B0UGE7_IXORI
MTETRLRRVCVCLATPPMRPKWSQSSTKTRHRSAGCRLLQSWRWFHRRLQTKVSGREGLCRHGVPTSAAASAVFTFAAVPPPGSQPATTRDRCDVTRRKSRNQN